jgi:cytochrome b
VTGDSSPAPVGSTKRDLTILVWNRFVRLSHWIVIIAVAVALFTHGGLLSAHRIAGYLVLALTVARIIHGFGAHRYARFANFVPGPTRLVRYLQAMTRGTERRYIGLNPAGGAMVVVLLVLLLLISLTGVVIDTPGWRDHRPLQMIHSVASDVLMLLIGVHLLGVLYASYRHRENLIAAMFSGKKRGN